jgi:rod shape-determining protein MreD
MAGVRARSIFTIAVTIAVALMLTIFPLPDWAQPYRPQWPLMVLAYWSMALPLRVGVFAGWVTGLFTDVITGALLGHHALGYALAIYVVLAVHRRLRLYPWWQQAAAVGGVFGLERLVSFLVIGATTGEAPTWQYWLSPLVGTLLWPWVFVILRDVRRKFRVR